MISGADGIATMMRFVEAGERWLSCDFLAMSGQLGQLGERIL